MKVEKGNTVWATLVVTIETEEEWHMLIRGLGLYAANAEDGLLTPDQHAADKLRDLLISAVK